MASKKRSNTRRGDATVIAAILAIIITAPVLGAPTNFVVGALVGVLVWVVMGPRAHPPADHPEQEHAETDQR